MEDEQAFVPPRTARGRKGQLKRGRTDQIQEENQRDRERASSVESDRSSGVPNAKRRRGSQDEDDENEEAKRYGLRKGRNGAEGEQASAPLFLELPPVKRAKPAKAPKRAFAPAPPPETARYAQRSEQPLFFNYNSFVPPPEFYTSENPFLANFTLSVDGLLYHTNRLERRREDLRPSDPLLQALTVPDFADATRAQSALEANEKLYGEIHRIIAPTWTMSTQIRAYETRQKQLRQQHDELIERLKAIRHEAQQNEDRFVAQDVSIGSGTGSGPKEVIKMADLIVRLGTMKKQVFAAEEGMKKLRKELAGAEAPGSTVEPVANGARDAPVAENEDQESTAQQPVEVADAVSEEN